MSDTQQSPEKQLKKWLDKHEKQDHKAFESIHNHLDRLNSIVNNDLVLYKLEELKKDIKEIKQEMKENATLFVTKVEFTPIKNLVYGLVSLILASVVGAVLGLVILRG